MEYRRGRRRKSKILAIERFKDVTLLVTHSQNCFLLTISAYWIEKEREGDMK